MLPQFNSIDDIPYSAINCMSQIPCSPRENGSLACYYIACNIVPLLYSSVDAAVYTSSMHIQHTSHQGQSSEGCDRCSASELPFHAGVSKSLDLHAKFLILSHHLFSGKLNFIFKYWFSLNHFKLYLNNSQSPL